MRIAALVGDYYHHEEDLRISLEKILDGTGHHLQMINPEELLDLLATKPDWFILSKEGRVDPNHPEYGLWIDAEQERVITEYTASGGRMLVWHSGLAGYPPESELIRMVKGYFQHHPPIKPVTYRAVGAGVEAWGLDTGLQYTVEDEHYFTYCETEQTEVFLTAHSEEGESPAGWSHSYGNGSVVALTPSHTREGLFHGDLVALVRGILVEKDKGNQ